MARTKKTAPRKTWRRVTVSGIVQGVGFRPTVYRLARKHGLVGGVRNTAYGVELILGGPERDVRVFLDELPRAIPAPGRIERMTDEPTDPIPGCEQFSIASSVSAETIEVVIPPDQATCPDCLRELFDPDNRRFGYPLITCTVCGPRYSIIESLPYDRERTTMRAFPLCEPCRAEYENPDDRRFHAETVACSHCGPNLELLSPNGPVVCADPLLGAVDVLRVGRIVAIKGIGGYHLACDATNAAAIAELRRRKGRPHKPFAIMVSGLEHAQHLCFVSDVEAAVLRSPEAPIVLLKRRGQILPDLLAPDNDRLGIMLPYTPIQHLLARHFDALVMTSGNITDEPIRYTEQGLRDLLGPIADFALIHPREIVNPSDDSIIVVQRGQPVLVRRARGHVPTPLSLDLGTLPILAAGADLKNACAFALRQRVYFSPHIGDLEYPPAFRRHLEEIDRFGKWFGVRPSAVACDLHPGYFSTQNAHRLAAQWGARLIEVQHHHAHIAACLAEHGLNDDVIGVAFDGTGYGTDGAIWGGEFMVASRGRFRRVGHLACHSLPGGERSIHEPWQMLAAYLLEIFGVKSARAIFQKYVAAPVDVQPVAQLLAGPLRAPRTSSVGRLFDAVGVLLGFPTKISFEAQNAVALESLCQGDLLPPYELQFGPAGSVGPDDDRDTFEIGLWGLFEGIAADLQMGRPRDVIANRFHATVVEMIVSGCRRIREQTGLARVALSGGCFVNTVLVEGAVARLEEDGFELLLRRRVPPNDAGIALGQIAVASGPLQSA
jgi:hydrogenase maturation protein HypF